MSFTVLYLVGAIVALVFGFRAFTVSHGKETTVTGRDILAVFLILLGIGGTYASIVQLQDETTASAGSNAGFSTNRCGDLPNVLCYGPGNSGAVLGTNSTLCVNGLNNCTVCPLSPSPCLTQVQSSSSTCTIVAGAQNCSATVTFNPAYTVVPVLWEGQNGYPVTTVTKTVLVSAIDNPVLTFQAANVTWKNMPATDQELNGYTGQRTFWQTPAVFTAQTSILCVDGVSVTAPNLKVQYATSAQTTWTNLGTTGTSIAGLTGGSLTCSATDIPALAANTAYYFRVMGNDTFGPVNDIFGTIQLFLSGRTTSNQNVLVPVNCFPDYLSLTATSVKIFTTCPGPLDVTKTFTTNWRTGILA